MSKFAKIPLDPYGVVADTNPLNVDKEWTSATNMRFNNDSAEKTGGETLGATPTEQPLWLQFNGDHVSPKWIYMGDGTIRVTDFDTDTDIDTGGLATPGVTNWDSSLFNNIPIMNNGVDAPMTWDGNILNTATTLPAFPIGTSCKSIRPYRGFLVALNITESAVAQPNRLIWSALSDAGALPPSWDIADPTKLGGDVWLTQDRAEIIDGLALRDFFIIYKTHSMILMQLVGGQEVMSFRKSQINSGLLAKNCVQEFNGMHFIVSDSDIVLYDGQSINSIADKRVRAEIFDNIDVVEYRNSYVTRFDKQDEMWFCYPTTGQTIPNRAAIWNWKDDTWTFRDLDESYHIASGLANFAVSDTYDQATYTYDSPSAAVTYAPVANNPTTDTLVSASTLKLGVLDEGFDAYGVAMPSSLEKLSMVLGDEDSVKFIKSVTPQITADNGTSIFIRVGTQMHPDDTITWAPEQEYVVGANRESHFTAKGRYISIRFRTQDVGVSWKLHGFYFKASISGNW